MTMQSTPSKNTCSLIRILILCMVAVLALSGCAFFAKKPPPVDARAQQQFYDLGVQHYSKENYKEARSAFQQAVDLGPDTTLGQKAQENRRKIQQILKTLDEIESK